MKLSYLDLQTTDPAFNLAMEQYVFDSLPRDRMYLMLWQNENAIIIGKHQNTLAEINEDFVSQQGIRVVRRLSGGGAVYHDLGNLNYTFITDDSQQAMDFGRFCRPVISALEKCGVAAELNGRNDMTIGGQKFSGNAQYRKDGRVMHHGTLLFDTDFSMLSGALQVDEEKIKAKGVKSVRSRVTNIRPHLPEDMTLAAFRRLLLRSILEEMPGQPYALTETDLAAVEAIRKDRYDTWLWNYGKDPACTIKKRRRFDLCGTVEAYISLKKGLIEDISFRGDFFSTEDPAALSPLLTGKPLTRDGLTEALGSVNAGRFFCGLTAGQLLSLLTE